MCACGHAELTLTVYDRLVLDNNTWARLQGTAKVAMATREQNNVAELLPLLN